MSALSKTCRHKEFNSRGDTPLHLAAKDNSHLGKILIKRFLTEDADANARNKWHQTPLHYAAIALSFKNIETLIQIPGIDVNSKDINGYNALQCLIASDDGSGWFNEEYSNACDDYALEYETSDNPKEPVDPNTMISTELRNAISIFVSKGTDLNNQTVFGNSILHIASHRTDSTALLRYFILNFPDLDLNLINKRDENFLHTYNNKDSFENTFDLLDFISNLDNSRLKILLSTRNDLGRTPWTLMIGSAITIENLRKIFSYGISAETNDNLGNTVLHRACYSIFEETGYVEVLQYLIEICPDINAKNIYGESALSMPYDQDFLKLFLKTNADWNIKDKWGRSPLMSLMKCRPLPEFLATLMEKGKGDINTRDIYGSTPLHVAAYQNYEEQVEILLKYGADINALDDLTETPFDTAKKHRSFRCLALLTSAIKPFMEQVPYGPVTFLCLRKKTFEDILQDIPKSITSSRIETKQDIQTLLDLPSDLNLFMNNLLESYFTKNPKYLTEEKDIAHDVNTLVGLICKQIGDYDSRFEISVFPSGSMAEGTKIDRPNEFDFILCLDKLNDVTDIVTEGLAKHGFACLKLHKNEIAEDYLPFTDADGYVLPSLILKYFYNYLQKALYEPHLWKSGNLYFNCQSKSGSRTGKPVFTINTYWFGSVHKQLEISIDLVPAVYKKGWWPPNIDVENIPLADGDVKAAGCFLTLQAKSHKFENHELHDCVSRTCNTDVNQEDAVKNRMMRISAAPAEICLMNSLPKNFRRAYVLAKVLKNICPEIDVETKQYKLEPYDFEYARSRKVKPSDLITSYMLKNGIFYVFEKLKMQINSVEDIDVFQITANICSFLLGFIKPLRFGGHMHMRPYFLSNELNVFKKPENLSPNKIFILHLQREFCIKLVLGMLNEPFPRECLATNMLLGHARN